MARIKEDAVVRVEASGQAVRADCFGNNAPVECPACLAYPVLLIALKGWRGYVLRQAWEMPPLWVRESISRMTWPKMSCI